MDRERLPVIGNAHKSKEMTTTTKTGVGSRTITNQSMLVSNNSNINEFSKSYSHAGGVVNERNLSGN